jgi:hypothetical protein
MSHTRLLQIFVGSLIVVLLIAGIAGYYLGRNNVGMGGPSQDAAGEAARSDTREDVPAGTTVPDPGAQVASNIAVPEGVAPAAPGVDSKKRQFSVEVRGDAFVPDTVIVSRGDIAQINFLAVDKDYDLVQPDYGFSLALPQGEKRLLEAQFPNAGKYVFYCPSCGGPDSGPKGYIIVVP